MSNNSQLNQLGEQMKGALNDALTTGNYDNLKNLVSDTVSSAIKEAGTTTSKAWQQKEEWKRQQEARRGTNASQEWLRQQEIQKQQKAELSVNIRNSGKVAGILMMVFGGIANVPLCILSLIGIFCGWGTVGILLGFLCVSVFFICYGKSKVQLVDRAKRYVKLCGTKMYAEIEELAAQVGQSRRKVERELRRILQKGIIPTAHMDQKGTHLMLNEVVYQQYIDAENARLLREKEETEPKTELEQMIEEGQQCIEKLRYMNDLIPGEVISAKLDQLENVLREIFQRLEKEPGQMNRMHKVMNYYLPTTLKLVTAYHEFDLISSPGEEITSAKTEIEATLDTINEAFVELLNSLFQDTVYDVTTDAQVLQTMLAKEGLTKDMIS